MTSRLDICYRIMAELKHPHIVSYLDSYHLQEGEFSYICIVQVRQSGLHVDSSVSVSVCAHVFYLTLYMIVYRLVYMYMYV